MYAHLWNADLCRTPTDSELAQLRLLRRDHAKGESDPMRDSAKFHKRRVRAATILVNFYEGTGAFEKTAPANAFPAELREDMAALLGLMVVFGEVADKAAA